MTRMSPAIDHYLSEFARVERGLPGQGEQWLANLRRDALDRLVEAGLPSVRQEDWKYTDVRPIAKRSFETRTEEDDAVAAAALDDRGLSDLPAHRLVFVSGRFSPALSDIGALPDGAVLKPLSQALAAPTEALRNRLGTALDGQASGFSELNSAFMTDGVYLELASGVALDKPVYALFLGRAGEHPLMANLRHFVHLGENAQATLVEHYAGLDDGPYLSNAVTEIFAARGAHLARCRLQMEADRGYHVGSAHALQQRDSRIAYHNVDFGGRLARTDTNSRLNALGAETDIYGLYVPNGRRHIDNHTRIDHLHPQGRSREIYKGVLMEHGRGVFNGKIIVHRDAQKTDSEQSSAALLLSKNAEVDAKPELEIYADDVKCAHGSTVGQLDEDSVFYLRSRGVGLDAARSLLTYSFADEVIQAMENRVLRRYVESGLLARLPNGEQIQELL